MSPTFATHHAGAGGTKRRDARALLIKLLSDNEWHTSESIAPNVMAIVGCGRKTVFAALVEIGGEQRWRPGVIPRRSDWRLPLND